MDQVTLKLKPAVTVDPAALRFTGTVSCFVDEGTGDVAGLQLGTAPPLCSTTGTRRSFSVPADSYIADFKVAVDKATDLVGELVFVVKSNSSLTPTAVFSCGKKGGLPVSVTPKLSALGSVSATCKSAPSGGAAVGALVLDPSALSVVVTTTIAPPTPPAQTTRYAYVTNSQGAVYICEVGSGGTLNCPQNPTSVSGNRLPAIAVTSGYAYMSVNNNVAGQGMILACGLGPAGLFTTCTTVLSQSNGQVLAIGASGGNLVYSGDQNNAVTPCTVAPGGGLSCSTTLNLQSSLVYGIALSGATRYLIDILGGSYTCSAGPPLSCPSTSSPLYPQPTPSLWSSISVSGSYAYITRNTGLIYVCNVSPLFCPDPAAATVPGTPRGIAVSGGYAFVATQAGDVYACTVGSGRTLTCPNVPTVSNLTPDLQAIAVYP